MKNLLLKSGYPLTLLIIILIVCFQNYSPGTYLSGWDTLHPEFDFSDYFKRTISMWQQHQGLGAVASQAHASELPRLLIYYISSIILPESFLRYSYFFICLIAGPLGMYFFIKEFFRKDLTAFLSGLLYLLNLVTLQHFNVPLEMFATHYASLPWIMLFSTKYLMHNKKRDLGFFVLTIIFSASLAHTPTLYYSFLILFAFYLLLAYKFLVKSFKRIAILIGLILLLNSYWMLPNLYYIVHYGNSVITSKIHYQFSERAFQTGTNYGNILDTSLLKNFLFDWGEYDANDERFVFLLKVWKDHLNNPIYLFIGLAIFVSVISGLIFSLKSKNKTAIVFLPFFIIPFIFIANDNFIFRYLVEFLENYSPTLKESLRFPFTKFSTFFLFSFCIYFAVILNYLIPKTKKYLKKYNQFIWGFVISLLLVFYSLPAFTGNLISPGMRVNIPNEYFSMFEWFKTQNPNTRIASFPMNTFWGWVYYNFGYEGAGFIWFGLDQPILDREFDRWHPRNEDYYYQMSQALYSGDVASFESVLEKYNINWLTVDKNIIDVSSPKATFFNQLEEMIGKSGKIIKEKQFNNIDVYKVNLDSPPNNFISILPQLKTVGPVYNKTNNDQGFKDNGNYISENESEIYYPFRSLLSNRNPDEVEFKIEETKDNFTFRSKIPSSVANKKLYFPKNDNIIWFDQQDLEQTGIYQPSTSYNGQEMTVTIPKIKNYFSSQIDPAKQISLSKLKNCDYLSAENPSSLRKVDEKVVEVNDKSVLRLNSVLSNNCTAEFLLPNMSHEFGYLITVQSRNIENKSILFWIENLTSKKSDLETYLPKSKDLKNLYFVQPPMEKYGQGYFLHLDNVSFNKRPSVNDLGEISIYPIPYDFLTQIHFGETENNDRIYSNCVNNVYHPIAFYYQVNINNDCKDSSTLVLSQSYDKGWMAFDTTENKLEVISDKKLINNWANGWTLNTEKVKSVIVFFIPQLLQLMGYLLFIMGIILFVIL